MSGLRRVIVGASGSPGNLCALRYAEHLARASGATLIPVHAWIPPGGDLADWRCPSLYLRRVWTEDARQRLAESLQATWGQSPADLTIAPEWRAASPAPCSPPSRASRVTSWSSALADAGRWPTGVAT
jgi:universal stress protein family protein